MPRQAKYNEHVNDHQLYFCKEVEKRMGSIDVVENVNELANIIEQHDIEASNSTMNSKDIDTNASKKGTYDLFKAFAVEEVTIALNLLIDGDISMNFQIRVVHEALTYAFWIIDVPIL